MNRAGVLVDTDVFSYLFKGDSRAAWYRSEVAGRLVYLSFMTAAELEQWALKRTFAEHTLERLRQAMAACTMLVPDERMTRLWARVSVHRQRAGRRIETADCWVVATALRYDLPLVTHNADDYRDIEGLRIISHG